MIPAPKSAPQELAFDFQLPRQNPLLRNVNDKILIEADQFKLIVDGVEILDCPFMPIVELALQLMEWVDHVELDSKDFYYDSVEHDEAGIVFFKKVNGGWQVGSIWQKTTSSMIVPLYKIRNAVNNFIGKLDAQLAIEYGFNLYQLR